MHVCVSNEHLVRIFNVPVHDRETNVEMFAVENGKNCFKTHFVKWSNILNRALKCTNLKMVLSVVCNSIHLKLPSGTLSETVQNFNN